MKIFCSGIGGIGLSAYASLQRVYGHTVSGSDRSPSALTEDLKSQGIDVIFDQSGVGVPADADLFVYSEAIPASAPERKKATELGIPEQSYPQALGELSRGKKVIAVCGTHGKSSTTAMASRLLLQCGMDPTIVVGTKLKELDGRNWRSGASDIFLLEACEYRRSFLQYNPAIILLTTCDGDHFDYFKNTEDYQQAFVEFAKRLSRDGTIITHGGDTTCAGVVKKSGKTMLDADTFPLISLQTPGLHMRQNAQLVLALASVLGIEAEQAVRALEPYAGSWRRIEERGTYGDDITVIDDYGHHPREIRATLAAIKEHHAPRRIVCAFQPHTHDRTLKLYEDFLSSFSDASVVLLPDIYDARSDIETGKVDIAKFAKDIAARSGSETIVSGSLANTRRLLMEKVLRPHDVLVCMGAGDITNLATQFVGVE